MGILLFPDLDPTNPTVRLLADAARWDRVAVFADRDLAAALWSKAVTRWEGRRRDRLDVATWSDGTDQHETQLLDHLKWVTAGARLSGPEAPLELRRRVVQNVWFSQGSGTPIQINATRLPAAFASTAAPSWDEPRLGLCTPEEALLIALLIGAHHGEHLVRVEGESVATTDGFNWYSALAQLALPAYLPIFAHSVEGVQRGDGSAQSLVLDALQEAFVRVRQLLRIHDQLGWEALRESASQGSDTGILRQAELVFDAVSGVTAILDTLTVWLVAREGIAIADKQRDLVVFHALYRGRAAWTKQFVRYREVAELLRQPLPPLIGLAMGIGRVGYQHHTLLGVPLESVIPAPNPEAWIDKETAGSIRIDRQLVMELGLPDGRDGLILLTDEAFALPWRFVGGLVRDSVQLVAGALEMTAAADGVALAREPELFRPRSPYAEFALRFTDL